MGKIELASVPRLEGTDYPAPYDEPCQARVRQALGDAAGLTQFGVNLVRMAPGSWSSQRHWHTEEDEFIWVVEGEITLVTDQGEQLLRPGDCAGFKAGVADGHHLQNKSDRPVLYLEMGSRRPEQDKADYPDIDLHWAEATGYTHKDGRPYGQKP